MTNYKYLIKPNKIYKSCTKITLSSIFENVPNKEEH